MTKKAKVLRYLQRRGSITPRQAMALCQSWRLADIIFKLWNDGWRIETENIHRGGVIYARYSLHE